MSTEVRDYLLGLQARIVAATEAESGEAFLTDAWQREPGGKLEGDGLSRLIEGGRLLERGGCNFSHVKGQTLPVAATQHRAAELANAPFEAMGVSLVFHPRNPYVPTVHMNVRMLAALPRGREPVVWFGTASRRTRSTSIAASASRCCRSATTSTRASSAGATSTSSSSTATSRAGSAASSSTTSPKAASPTASS